MNDERDEAELKAMLKAFYAGVKHHACKCGPAPTIPKHISQTPMDITFGAFNESLKAAEQMGAEIAINACLEMVATNPALIHQPAPYPRRILENAVKTELENKERRLRIQPPFLEGERPKDEPLT